MGMDQYIVAVPPKETLGRKTDTPVTVERVNSAHVHWYWRRNMPLQQWMKAAYMRKGGGDRNFNNPSNLVLDEDDLDRLLLEFPDMSGEVQSMRVVLRDGAKLVYCPDY